MPAFTYTARTAAGELRTATVEAATAQDVVAQLRRQRMTVVKVDEISVQSENGQTVVRLSVHR